MVQLVSDHLEGFIPCDGRIVCSAFAQDHRMGEASLLAQPVLVMMREFFNGILGEEIRVAFAGISLPGHRFRAVLTEFKGAAFAIRFRPRATHAIHAMRLVEHAERAAATQERMIASQMFSRAQHRRNAGGVALRRVDLYVSQVAWKLRFHGMWLPTGLLELVSGWAV